MDWLTTPGNFVQWRGNKHKGLNKEALAGEIILILVDHGIHHRNNKEGGEMRNNEHEQNSSQMEDSKTYNWKFPGEMLLVNDRNRMILRRFQIGRDSE
jgi:hypothetical protein